MSQAGTVHPRSPNTTDTTDVPEDRTMTTLTHQESSPADAGLRRLEQFADEAAVETLLTSFLARRRAMRQARREQAVRQARHEHEVQMQQALLGTGLTHLR